MADFEAAGESSPASARALWNAYQLYLQEFRLDQASRIQPVAWAGIRSLVPFDYRAEEKTHGELVASPLRVGDVWSALFATRDEWVRNRRETGFLDLFFRPVPGEWVPAFLAAGFIWAAEARTGGAADPRLRAMTILDPKIAVALLSWAIYSFQLYARRAIGWSGRRAAWLSAVAFGIVLVNFVAIGYLSKGHNF